MRTGGEDETAAGVRVATKFAGDKLEVGASAVFQGAQAGDTSIVGSDLTWRVSPETRVRAEVAQSQSDDPLRPDASTAWLVEGKHASEHLEARAWARETESGFGVDQQLTADTGTRSAGVDARYKFTETVWRSAAKCSTSRCSRATRRACSPAPTCACSSDTWSVGVGVRHVADEDASGDERVSDQAFVTGSVDVWDGRVTLRGEADATLGGKDASVDYPARSILGVDYHLSNDTTLFAEYEHAEGDQLEADITRIGMRTRPVGAHAGQLEHQHAGHRIRSAHLRELRPHAGLRVQGTLGLRRRRRPDQHAARPGPRAAESECAAGLGLA